MFSATSVGLTSSPHSCGFSWLFFVFVAARELNKLFGDGELFKIFFTHRSSELKSTRRTPVSLLVRLCGLIGAHSVEVLEDARSAPPPELVAILRSLAQGRTHV